MSKAYPDNDNDNGVSSTGVEVNNELDACNPGTKTIASPTAQKRTHSTIVDKSDAASSTQEKPRVAASSVDEAGIEAELERHKLDCLLLEDATRDDIPLHLKQLLQPYIVQARSSFASTTESVGLTTSELLLLLIYSIALECGFVLDTIEMSQQTMEHVVGLPAAYTFHAENLVWLTRHTPLKYTHDEDKLRYYMQLRSLLHSCDVSTACLKTVFSMVVSGDFAIVTLSPRRRHNDEENSIESSSSSASTITAGSRTCELKGYSVCLSTARYVIGARMGRGADVHHNFQNLGELSFILRERLFTPMRNQQLSHLSGAYYPYPALLGLPEELYERVLCYLSNNQLKMMANVCREMHYQVSEFRRRRGELR